MTRVHDLPTCATLLDTFQSYGHTELDTARLYGFGSTEEYLTQLDWQKRGLAIGTKLSPKKIGPKPYSHKAEDLRRGILASKEALKTERLEIFWLHMPDVSHMHGKEEVQCVLMSDSMIPPTPRPWPPSPSFTKKVCKPTSLVV
jgi:aryl-alcohol dehydrogenase-like predicted oxidoreductase